LPEAGQGARRGLAAGPRRIDGARPLLFERLFDGGGRRVHDALSLSDAVEAAIGDLLATRPPDGAASRPPEARSVLDYGAAPPEGFAAASEPDRLRVAADIRAAILAFEPRLIDPQVAVAPDPDDPGGLAVAISGVLRVGALLESFAFVAPLKSGGAAP
jgi:type VI secretion system lysozyme-like protein